MKAVPLRSGIKQEYSFSPFLLSILLEVLAIPVREEKGVKRIQIGKEVKMSLLDNDMILYTEAPKGATKTTRSNQQIW